MTKVKHAASSRRRRKKTLKAARGQYSAGSRLYKIAKEAVRKSLISSYIDRKKKKRLFRSLWITRISAACKLEGISYSKFIAGLRKAKISMDRKILADLAANDRAGFKTLVKRVKT